MMTETILQKVLKVIRAFDNKGVQPDVIYLGRKQAEELKKDQPICFTVKKIMGIKVCFVDEDDHFNIAETYIKMFRVEF